MTLQPSKEFEIFCNSLRCPLCDSQLDGNVHPKEAKLYCVANNDEYLCHWWPNHELPEREFIEYIYPKYKYTININKKGVKNFHTIISRFNLDVVPALRVSTRKEVFNYVGNRILFFRKRMEEDLFLKKLKTYSVFS